MDLEHIDIERTRKAIDTVHERWQQQRPAAVTDLLPLLAASRVLVELLANGERVEPDYEAAARALMPLSAFHVGSLSLHDIRVAVDAAIGDKLLVDPPTEEE